MTAEWIQRKAAEAINPPRVAHTLEQLCANWPDGDTLPLPDLIAQFPLGEASLLHLISVSGTCATRLVRHPEILLWLTRPEICSAARTHREMLAEWETAKTDPISAHDFRCLRVWKGREMLRIALREVAEVAPLEETTLEISLVAEICVREVYQHWNRELRSHRGEPETEFAILGLGKLGGRELNHSSDIDLIFLYGEEGQVSSTLSYHEWFNLLGSKIVETFAALSSAGPLFRIDLRLRPEGKAGPLARSLESMENYYSGFGETWERLALIKARGICGSRELAYEFLRLHQPFIYPKTQTRDLLEEVVAIKRRIERDIVGYENIGRDVKLGAGGIREIEFVVQALQLLHGARHAFLQETSTLKALPLLAELELIPGKDARELETAYRFLRTIEHRLQIEAEQQIRTIPDNGESLDRLARSLGFASKQIFTTTLRDDMQKVRSIFHRIIAAPSKEPEAPDETPPIFRDTKTATKSLADLGKGSGGFHIAARTRQVLRNLRPLLFKRLARTGDPDAVLNQFIRFVEAYGLRSMLFELLVENPRLLELLIKIFDASRLGGDLLIRRPQLLEDITRGGVLDREILVPEHLRRLDALNITPASLDPLRIYRQTQLLRILLRDTLKLADLKSVFAEQTALAEACLIFVNRAFGNESNLTIIGLGKFGGSEISYGADLDVLFVGNDVRAAQQLMVAMAQRTAEGLIAILDARLRPEGEKGDLVSSITAYETYYATRAQLWEAQSLTRARAINGPAQDQFMEVAKRFWSKAAEREDLFSQINGMLHRIRHERGKASDLLDFKTGTGGVIEAEFLVQALQMKSGTWNPRMMGALTDLTTNGLLQQNEADQVRESYEYLRSVESILRRWENKTVSSIPPDESDQRKLAHQIGAENLEAFGERYREVRERIHSIYSRYLH